MKKITIKNENREALVQYLTIKARKAEIEKEEKALKANLKPLFAELGKAYKDTDKTSYIYGTVQVQGKAKAVVYKETSVTGSIDWQAYAMALGGTAEGAEAYRKATGSRTTIDWATDKQAEELGL